MIKTESVRGVGSVALLGKPMRHDRRKRIIHLKPDFGELST